jgi:carbamoyl-phosphate synthase small subunit
VDGEVVFNTSMAGYQEILTDPSYRGQIVTMTYPHIGNYGVNRADVESRKPQVSGFIIRERSRVASNFRSEENLEAYLREYGILAIEGIDTRALTKRLRVEGAMKGVLSTDTCSDDDLVDRARSAPGIVGRDLVQEVSTSVRYAWTEGFETDFDRDVPDVRGEPFRVAAMDFGIKTNILRCLVEVGCHVDVFPATATAEEVMAENPDGIFLSNGPGDPEGVPYAVDTVQKLVKPDGPPVFGICLGHQIMGLALGGKTFKLKFGHRGANQPVRSEANGRVEITSQNHGFAVDFDSLTKGSVEVTHINLNDRTVEGLRHRDLPAFSVQYHPESSPGPHDSFYLFQDFIQEMHKRRG